LGILDQTPVDDKKLDEDEEKVLSNSAMLGKVISGQGNLTPIMNDQSPSVSHSLADSTSIK